MRVTIKPNKNKKGFFTVVPHGSIDSETHHGFREETEPFLVKSTKGIIMDFKDVDYISSAGLGVLFSMQKYLKSNGAKLIFCHLKPQIQKLFEIMKTLPLEHVFKSIEEADAYLYQVMDEEINKQKK